MIDIAAAEPASSGGSGTTGQRFIRQLAHPTPPSTVEGTQLLDMPHAVLHAGVSVGIEFSGAPASPGCALDGTVDEWREGDDEGLLVIDVSRAPLSWC